MEQKSTNCSIFGTYCWPKAQKYDIYARWLIEYKPCTSLLTISVIVLVVNDFIATTEKFLKRLLEVVIEGDVDDGVDHGVGVGEHVDPELIPLQPWW